MKLSQLIREAQEALAKHGDIEVIIETPGDEHAVENTEVFQIQFGDGAFLFSLVAHDADRN